MIYDFFVCVMRYGTVVHCVYVHYRTHPLACSKHSQLIHSCVHNLLEGFNFRGPGFVCFFYIDNLLLKEGKNGCLNASTYILYVQYWLSALEENMARKMKWYTRRQVLSVAENQGKFAYSKWPEWNQ